MTRFHYTIVLPLLLALPVTSISCDGNGSNQVEAGTQTAQESDDLLQLREEEKLARDVYLTLHAKWGNDIFEKISASEQKHMDKVKGLLDGFGIADPVTDDSVGVFVNTELAALYGDLVASGMQSEVDALLVGATIEDLDIFDIRAMQDNTSKSAILDVYDKLECGSNNHLRSFTSQISALNASYVPQYLATSDIEAIVNTGQSSCGGKGNN